MRVADRSVLRLIRMWLQSPVAEPGGSKGGSGQWSRSRKGTPQGGVISPLLANLYLHWFDWKFHRPSGPAQWAGAKLVRYADDFVVLARYQGARLVGFVESQLETWLGLEINRDKTRVVNLKEKGASLDFLGFTFRYDDDLQGRQWRYLNVSPSKKALQRERQTLHEMTDHRLEHCRRHQLPERCTELGVGSGGCGPHRCQLFAGHRGRKSQALRRCANPNAVVQHGGLSAAREHAAGPVWQWRTEH